MPNIKARIVISQVEILYTKSKCLPARFTFLYVCFFCTLISIDYFKILSVQMINKSHTRIQMQK
jgi:hypothetical protein